MNPEAAKALFGFLSSSVVVGVVVVVGRYCWYRTLWRRFRKSVQSWAEDDSFRDDLSEEEWKSLTAVKLYDAGFSPVEIQSLLELAVLVARGEASLVIRGRVQFEDHETIQTP